MSNSFTSTIHEEGYVTISQGGVNKNISIQDYMKGLANICSNLENQDSSPESFRLPDSIHSFSRTSAGYTINLYYPSAPADILYDGISGRTRIMLPNIMIRIKLQNILDKPGSYCFGNIKWFATDKLPSQLPVEWPDGPRERDHIWALPLPNIYNDGNMCTGGNVLPSVIYSDWTILHMLYTDVLIKSQFNSDLGIPNINTSARSWITKLGEEYVKNPESFPYGLLTN